MKIRIYPDHPNLPIGPASGLVGSAMPLAIVGVPPGATGVDIAAFNADGTACSLAATKLGGEWVATVPASHFASYGTIARGLQVSVTFKDAAGVSQTVLFVGDMRIEAAAPGDPAGHGVPSVPITEVAEVPEGSPMKDIRDTVNQLARIVSGTATALALAFCAFGTFGATILDKIPGTTPIYTAAEIDAMPSGGITTNDVCDIVTNNVDVNTFSEWAVSSSSQFPIYLIFYDGQWRPVDIPDNPDALVGDPKGDANSTNLVWSSGSDSPYDITATRTVTSSYSKNSLGIAGETGAVSEILMIGSDNKLYHLRIGSGGSIDVYMEAN